MKRNFFSIKTLATIAMATGLLASCSSDDTPIDKRPGTRRK